MINKITFTFLGFLFFNVLNAQVGINNTSPKQALHISGTDSGISGSIVRIDGLSRSLNTAHENDASLKRVFATNNGDLVILDNNQTNKLYISPSFASTSIPGGTEKEVANYVFTLDYPSVVHVEARAGITITSPIGSGSSSIMRNGQARPLGCYFKFISAPSTIAINKEFGESIISYSTSTEGVHLNGLFYVEPRKDLYLPKGSYEIALYGFSSDSDMNLSVNNIGQSSQQMRISITPVIY